MITFTDSVDLYSTSLPGLPLIVIENAYFRAVIAFQGAQLLEFTIRGEPLLWLSSKAIFAEGKSIRGGIPLCAPWFGVQADPEKIKHGFVRNQPWTLHSKTESKDSAEIIFEYQFQGDKIFPHQFKITYKMLFSRDGLDLELLVDNQSNNEMPFGWAFHSYLPVDDLEKVYVSGLAGKEYLDAAQKFRTVRQEGNIYFKGEVDRVYENVPEEQIIHGARSLQIIGENCPTAIIWNPGEALAGKMADVEEGYKDYICVERGAAFKDSWTIPPATRQRAKMRINSLK